MTSVQLRHFASVIVELWLRLAPDAKASAELGGSKAIQSDVGSCLRALKDVAAL